MPGHSDPAEKIFFQTWSNINDRIGRFNRSSKNHPYERLLEQLPFRLMELMDDIRYILSRKGNIVG